VAFSFGQNRRNNTPVRPSWKSLVSTALVVVVMAAAAWTLWPASLGGRTTYVATHGVSMEPGFHSGDLAILHTARDYQVGQVAAYHSDTLHTVVMHRIHAVDAGGGFVFKGDNNAWLDLDHPAQNKLMGRLWLRVPGGGRYLRLAHTPWALGILGALVIGTGSAKGHRGTRRRSRTAAVRRSLPGASVTCTRRAALVAVAAAVAVSLGAAFLWSAATTMPGTRTLTISHSPAIAYDGAAHRGATYPDGRVHTGQPVYLHLVNRITVRITDPLSSSAPLGPVDTTAAVTVALATSTGWSTTLSDSPAVDLSNGPATATIDLPLALRRLRAVAAETGANEPGGTLTVSAHLVSRTSAAGHPIDSAVDTTYGFSLSSTDLRPVATQAPAQAAGTGASRPTGLSTTVTLPTNNPATIGVRGHRLSIGQLRSPLTLLALACTLVAVGMVLAQRGATRVSPTRSSFGRRVVEVTSLDPDAHVVAVATPSALMLLADQLERPVLCLASEHGDVYAVLEDGVSYRYTDALPGAPIRHLQAAA
jgi:signal peptidase I